MQNNFTKNGSTVKNSENKKFWDLRNKDKEYGDVVNHLTTKVNENIRGVDKQHHSRQMTASVDFTANQNPLNSKAIENRITEMQEEYQGESFM